MFRAAYSRMFAQPAAHILPVISLLVISLLTAPLAGAVPRYGITVIGGAGSQAWDINDSGQVAGESGGNGFLYSGGSMHWITGWGSTTVRGINNDGTVVGMAEYPDTEEGLVRHAYSYRDGVATDLGTLYGIRSQANAINNLGHVVGGTDIGGAPNWPLTPFLHRDGAMIDLGPFNGPWSEALAVNDLDQVVGYAGYESRGGELYPRGAFLWDAGTVLDLGGLAGTDYSYATGINNRGQVVGWYSDTVSNHAFLYENGALLALDTLIDPASGWTMREATAINEVGQIVGTACRGGSCHAVRLDLVSAIPEPASWSLLLAGGGLLAWRRRIVGRVRPGQKVLID